MKITAPVRFHTLIKVTMTSFTLIEQLFLVNGQISIISVLQDEKAATFFSHTESFFRPTLSGEVRGPACPTQ